MPSLESAVSRHYCEDSLSLAGVLNLLPTNFLCLEKGLVLGRRRRSRILVSYIWVVMENRILSEKKTCKFKKKGRNNEKDILLSMLCNRFYDDDISFICCGCWFIIYDWWRKRRVWCYWVTSQMICSELIYILYIRYSTTWRFVFICFRDGFNLWQLFVRYLLFGSFEHFFLGNISYI